MFSEISAYYSVKSFVISKTNRYRAVSMFLKLYRTQLATQTSQSVCMCTVFTARDTNQPIRARHLQHLPPMQDADQANRPLQGKLCPLCNRRRLVTVRLTCCYSSQFLGSWRVWSVDWVNKLVHNQAILNLHFQLFNFYEICNKNIIMSWLWVSKSNLLTFLWTNGETFMTDKFEQPILK